MIDRRTLLAAIPAFAVGPALAQNAPQALHTQALQTYERESGGRIGVYAENVTTSAKIAWRADERFVMCSTFKASLAALMLARVDRGEDKLDDMVAYSAADLLEYAPVARENLANGAMTVDAMCKAIVELSDNTCANLLLARAGGPAALTKFWRATGDDISRLDDNEPELNRTPLGGLESTTTPTAMAATLRRLVLGDVLAPASRNRLTEWLVDCKTGANRLRAGLPKDWKVGDKTGNNGKDASGDIAVTWPHANAAIVICAYTRGGTPTKAQIDTVFAAIGRMVGEQLA